LNLLLIATRVPTAPPVITHGRALSQPLTPCHAARCSSVELSFDAAKMIAAKMTIARIMWIDPGTVCHRLPF
jgi:hypothetical protein